MCVLGAKKDDGLANICLDCFWPRIQLIVFQSKNEHLRAFFGDFLCLKFLSHKSNAEYFCREYLISFRRMRTILWRTDFFFTVKLISKFVKMFWYETYVGNIM